MANTYDPGAYPSKRVAGMRKDMLVTDALRMELMRECERDGIRTKKLNHLARVLANLALDGNVTAIGMVMERMDGKVRQVSDVNVQSVSLVQLHIQALREVAGLAGQQPLELEAQEIEAQLALPDEW